MSDKKYLENHIIDITGQRFGKLTAVRFYGVEFNKAAWVFQCDCGNECITYAQDVKSGSTKSCGCARKDSAAKRKKRETERTSRYDFSPNDDHLYHVWAHKRYECRNGKRYGDRQKAEFYGGWNDHDAFRKWAFENGYDEESGRTALVRIDRTGNYTPDNCLWVTTKDAKRRRKD